MLKQYDDYEKFTWASCITNLLMCHGYGEVWLHQGVGDESAFLTQMKQTLLDNALQN